MSKFENLKYNIFTGFYTLFHKRDKKTVLVGSWMGTKFADNSRFLFQYLHDNKKELNLNNVVWATRNSEVNVLLNKMGYKSCLIGTEESKKWHLKAGIHIICNMAYDQPKFKADIDTKYSFGAKKIQLWHGAALKAVGAASNDAKRKGHKNNIFHGSKIASLASQGCWNDSFVLCTSKYDVWANQVSMNRTDSRFFISCYPRNCNCLCYLESEKDVINKLNKYQFSILYLPTFRSVYTNYIHPLTDNSFIEFLKKNDILWIEKPHTASDFDYSSIKCGENVLFLDANFDVNVLYENVSCLISDYSSALLDTIYKAVPTIMYIPDVDVFKNDDVGFLIDIEQYFDGITCKNMIQCQDLIKEILNKQYFTENRIQVFSKTKNKFFDDIKSSYSDIWQSIVNIK